MHMRTLLTATAIALATRTADAQVVDSLWGGGRDSAVRRAATALPEDARIRVALLRSRWVGRYQGIRGDTLFLGSPGQPAMAIRFNAVDTMWRSGRATRRGAGIGAITLGAIGIAAALGSGASDGATLTRTLIGAGSGAALGAGIGALIGAQARRWHRVFAATVPEEQILR